MMKMSLLWFNDNFEKGDPFERGVSLQCFYLGDRKFG